MQTAEHPVYDLHVYPTYAVCLKQRPPRIQFDEETGEVLKAEKSAAQIDNEANLKKNIRQDGLSAKATRRLVNAVNWLVASAKTKTIFDKSTGKKYTFKVNFVTLTLPTTEHEITDHFFKSVLLHNFINTCRAAHSMRNFVWKVETQANGNIHAHFTTDTFIHWRELRTIWNKILRSHGILQKYQGKHAAMSFDDYCGEYARQFDLDREKMRKAYDKGVSGNWSDPNTTDVHAVWKVDDIAGYLAKYMGKSEQDRRQIKGRLWSCSYSLSSRNKLTIEICGAADHDILEPLHNDEIKWKPIQIENKLKTGLTTIGDIFFYRLSDWGSTLKGRLLSLFNQFRYKIRHDLHRLQNDIFQVENIPRDMVSEPNVAAMVVPIKNQPGFIQQKFYFN